MRIAFITSGLEEGKNGVGDHIRLLARECTLRGHQCFLLALNDEFVSCPTNHSITVEGKEIPVFRLPRDSMSWKLKEKKAIKFFESAALDWISLHFVCYGFHRKGIIRNCINPLVNILSPYRVHIMFHELWLGLHRKSSLKEKLIGFFQRLYILRLVRKLNLSVLHTTNDFYQIVLQKKKVFTRVLPLFGNVPVVDGNADPWLFPLMAERGINIDPLDRDKVLLCIFWGFGTRDLLVIEKLTEFMNSGVEQVSKKFIMMFIGRFKFGQGPWRAFVNNLNEDTAYLELGEQPIDKVSELLNSGDIGISVYPVDYLGKSSTAAAMLEHGLPLLAAGVDETYAQGIDKSFLDNERIYLLKEKPFELLKTPSKFEKRPDTLVRNVDVLLKELHSH